MSVVGRLALVTGAGSGIGRAACQLLAKEGASVIAADKNINTAQKTVNNLESNGFNHLPLEISVENRTSIENCLKQCLDKYSKPPSIIVNAAGITRDNFLLKLSEKDFDEVLEVNLKGTFLVMQTFVKTMLEKEVKGSIINISSISGINGNIGQANYAASKAGVEQLTKTAVKEFADNGIRVNTILPGFIQTPMTDAIPDKVKLKLNEFVPMKRFGQPEEVAELIVFLASDKSSYVHGASILVSGGLIV